MLTVTHSPGDSIRGEVWSALLKCAGFWKFLKRVEYVQLSLNVVSVASWRNGRASDFRPRGHGYPDPGRGIAA